MIIYMVKNVLLVIEIIARPNICNTIDYSDFFRMDSPTAEIYTLSLHDALPICERCRDQVFAVPIERPELFPPRVRCAAAQRSEEHTSELQSHVNLVCRLLLEKKNIC